MFTHALRASLLDRLVVVITRLMIVEAPILETFMLMLAQLKVRALLYTVPVFIQVDRPLNLLGSHSE